MPPRLSHHKSRLGCNRCRARKVKCDEVHPRCGACARHSVSCDYPPKPARSLPDTPSRVKHRNLDRKSDHDQPMLDAAEVDRNHHQNHSSQGFPADATDQMLELQLMHEWVAYVCESICTTWRFWRYQAPVIAFRNRPVLDAMLALSALYASRQMPRHWVTVEGRMVSHDDGRINSMPLPDSALTAGEEWKGPSDERFGASSSGFGPSPAKSPSSRRGDHPDRDMTVFDSAYMLHVSRVYFDRALAAQSRAVLDLRPENVRATFMCSVLVSYYALFTLSEDSSPPTPTSSSTPSSPQLSHYPDASSETSTTPSSVPPSSSTTTTTSHPHYPTTTSSSPPPPADDAIQWFRLTYGTGVIVAQWMQFPNGHEWFSDAGAMYGPPDLTDLAALFSPSNRAPFAYLLPPAPSATDPPPPPNNNPLLPPTATPHSAYADAISYLGSIYLNLPLAGGSDTPLATCRRILAFPSCLTNTFFPTLVCEVRAPRALALLAHVFAVMKLVEGGVPWLKGVAGRQVRLLCGMVLAADGDEGDAGEGREERERWARWPLEVVEGRGGRWPADVVSGREGVKQEGREGEEMEA